MGSNVSAEQKENVRNMQEAILAKRQHLMLHFRNNKMNQAVELLILTHPRLKTSKEAIFSMFQVVEPRITLVDEDVARFPFGTTLSPSLPGYILFQSMIPMICDFMETNGFELVTLTRASDNTASHYLDMVFKQTDENSEVVFNYEDWDKKYEVLL